MSSRPQFNPQVVINAGSMAGNLTSSVTIIQKLSMCSYSYSWTGTSPVGTLEIQVSNDYSVYEDGTVKNAGTWNTLYLEYNGNAVSTIPVTGNTGNAFIDVDQIGAYAIQTVYTFTSGVGNLTAIINGKVA